METPKFELKDVFAVIDSGDLSRIWFPVEAKSVRAVVAYFSLVASQRMEPDAAVDFILKGIKTLTSTDFVHRRVLYDDPEHIADVYAKEIGGSSWYIKFRLDDDGDLEEVSFHPPRNEVTTAKGLKIKPGEIVYEEMRKMWVKRP